jgi:general secretion pathway protein G
MRKGFTLIELLVVISIIGILLGLSVFGLQGARQSSRDAKRKADLELIRSGLEIYKSDCNTYPTANIMTLTTLVGAAGVGCLGNTYISKIPVDPVPGTSSYSYVSAGSTYFLCALLETAPSPPMDKVLITNCGSCGTVACNYVVTNP